MNAFPLEFLDQMKYMLGEEYPAFLLSMDQPPALALRLNPRRAKAAAAAASFVEDKVPWAPLGRYLLPGVRPGASIAHHAGAFYVQEASAMAAAAALDAQPGERILDLCAAPGGKSTQIAAAMDNRGLLIANEPDPTRARILAGNLERMGVANALVVNAYPDKLADRWPAFFDAILVDAPCSGEGMFRRDPEARNEWRPASPTGCAIRQAEILHHAARMLKPGGRLIYSTCTFNRQENEGSIETFLSGHDDFNPEEFTLAGVGRSEGGMLRLFPHRLRGDGHFVARLRKNVDLPEKNIAALNRHGHRSNASAAKGNISTILATLQRDICKLPDFIPENRIILQGDRLFCIPEDAPDCAGLRVISPGIALLRAGRSHVEPEHALAMALPLELACRCVDLNEAQATAYLAGESIPLSSEKGWTLTLYNTLPLGWSKFSDGMLKNHLPKGLRRPT